MPLKTIDLARAVGISPQAVRDYEDQGVMPAVKRRANGYRIYTGRHLDALRTVRALVRAGYDRDQVWQVMDAVHSGPLDATLAIIDAHHARLDDQRQQADRVLRSIEALMSDREDLAGTSPVRGLTIGEAAKAVGVRTSTLRFWEQEGLVHPLRDASSGYRIYDRFQMRCLEVVALLRRLNFSFDSLRAVIDDIVEATTETSFQALEARRNEIFEASKCNTAATATLWNYISGRTEL
jgi:DNA-binding transcriptional MerR regulator